jgi:hypothetical protein
MTLAANHGHWRNARSTGRFVSVAIKSSVGVK